VLKEGVKLHFLKVIKKSLQKTSKSDSTQIGLHATPTSWRNQYPKLKLDTLSPMTITVLM